ncbi:MAG TPA: prepilin-type N-terminal cleavage/methylation domain-containing protein [Thiobacillus sp.]|nr:prepilin-type N-terminal cleavage/methylation domain-containing protein [Thiobacillus sp.]
MNQPRGFTLIELAIVLVIITILIGGLAVPLSAQIQARRIAETNRTLEEAREAIIGYAMSHRSTATCTCTYSPGNPVTATPLACLSFCPVSTVTDTVTGDITLSTGHRLPCPDKLDDGDPLTTDDGDGVADHVGADPTADCVKPYGYLPWATLGVANQDAWGNRLRYAVTDAFSRSAGFSNSDPGDLKVCDSSANAGTSDCVPGNVADKVPVVLVSYGPNGWGARNVNGKTQAPPSSNHEKENANTDTEFVSRTPSTAGDGAGEFDDLVVWISDGLLRSRVCPSGGCP